MEWIIVCGTHIIRIDIMSVLTLAVSVAGVLIAFFSLRAMNKENKEAHNQERIRATFHDFPKIRRKYYMADLSSEWKQKEYLSEMERFAAGVNIGAYDIDAVSRMSGSLLIHQYHQYLAPYIAERRKHSSHPETLYVEYECMMQKLIKIQKSRR